MRALLFIILCTLFFSCSAERDDFPVVDYEKMANKITMQTAAVLEKEKGLQFAGIGGSMMDDVKMMLLALQVGYTLDKSIARKLIVDCAEIYLNAINNDKEIRPYLHNYPFTPKSNIEISISVNPRIPLTEDRPISFVSLRRGIINYYVDKGDDTELQSRESYEDAVQIIQDCDADGREGD